MRRFIPTIGLFLLPVLGNAQDGVPALQKAIQATIKEAEHGVVSIVISRSKAYAQLDDSPATKKPGELGEYDPPAPQFGIGEDEKFERLRSLDLSDSKNVPEQFGSAIVIEKNLLLTPAHLVTGATKIFVRAPGGRGSYANIRALDPRSDLAVLELIRPIPTLKAIPFGDGDKVEKGEFVVSLANPFSVGFADGSPSASSGIVSNLRRRLPGGNSEVERNKLSLHHFGTLIQTDCRLNAGCSGGALLNLKGELIGIISSQAALVGLDTPGGFALPINHGLREVIQQLKKGKEVEYAFLGVQFSRDGNGLARLSHVIPGSPAEKGGLRDGDYVRSVGGTDVKTTDDLFLTLAMYPAGGEVKIERSAEPFGPKETKTITLGKFHLPREMIASVRPDPVAGLRVDYPTTLVRENWPRGGRIPSGVRIREVIPKSPADLARLQEDDVILEVEGRTVPTPAEFYQAMNGAKREVKLRVEDRQGNQRSLELPLR